MIGNACPISDSKVFEMGQGSTLLVTLELRDEDLEEKEFQEEKGKDEVKILPYEVIGIEDLYFDWIDNKEEEEGEREGFRNMEVA